MGVYGGTTKSWNSLQIQNNANFFASGGTVTEITQNGIVYRVHSFTTVGVSTLTVNRQLKNLEYLIVAGGGGSGGDGCNAGSATAGGAGGVLFGSTAISPETYNMVVGAGGAFVGSGNNPRNGNNSSCFGFVSLGGGGGGVADSSCTGGSSRANGAAGGSGGSGQSYYGSTYLGGIGTIGQGNSGAVGKSYQTVGNDYVTGGGGGAGGPGVEATSGVSGQPGSGGPGISFSITGTNTFYAGGGGGQSHNSSRVFAPAGVGNEIGGGGSAGNSGTAGIVIIRYPIGIVGQ